MNPLQRALTPGSARAARPLRIAIVSAALTAVILIGFAAVVGRLVDQPAPQRLQDELRERRASSPPMSASRPAAEPETPTRTSPTWRRPTTAVRIVDCRRRR